MEEMDFQESAEGPGVQQDTVFKEAVQMMVQAMALLHQDMRNQIHDANRRQEERIQDAMREHEQRMHDALRHQALDTSERIRRLEEALELRERRDARAQSEEGLGAAEGSLLSLQERNSWREPFAQLEARCQKLEESVGRAVESVFPRVALLVSHLEAKAEASPPRATATLGATNASNASPETSSPTTSSSVAAVSLSSTAFTACYSSTSSARYIPSTSSTSSNTAAKSRSLPPPISSPSTASPSLTSSLITPIPMNKERRDELTEALIDAARNGNLENTWRLLDAGTDPNCAGISYKTPLMEAASKGHTPVVALLLQRGADVHRRDVDEQTPLYFAAGGDRKGQCVRQLLDAGADPNCTNNLGWTPLMRSARYGYTSVVALLLQRGADVHRRDKDKETPLYFAAGGDRKGQCVRLLLDAGADPNSTNNLGWTPLMRAARFGYTSVVALLLERGADVHLKAKWGKTALHFAAKGVGEAQCVWLILDAGADPNCTDTTGKTPNMEAAWYRHTSVLALLLQRGADVHLKANCGRTALHFAAERDGEAQCVRLLLDAGANPNCADATERTPLMWAALKGHTPVVELLLEKGADVHLKAVCRKTALHYAANGDREGESARLLLDAGVDTNCTDATRKTPLMEAAWYGHTLVMGLLLERGADVHLRNKFGRTALHFAAERDDKGQCVWLLLDAGANVDAQDNRGSTALHRAKGCNNIAAIRLLTNAQHNEVFVFGKTDW